MLVIWGQLAVIFKTRFRAESFKKKELKNQAQVITTSLTHQPVFSIIFVHSLDAKRIFSFLLVQTSFLHDHVLLCTHIAARPLTSQ